MDLHQVTATSARDCLVCGPATVTSRVVRHLHPHRSGHLAGRTP
ncbi:hypothetical protein [Cellulomonas carbonis]|nr:hypothetical protein [Cellulomonas carbonis]